MIWQEHKSNYPIIYYPLDGNQLTINPTETIQKLPDALVLVPLDISLRTPLQGLIILLANTQKMLLSFIWFILKRISNF